MLRRDDQAGARGSRENRQGSNMLSSRPGYGSLELKADLYKESKTFRGRIWSTRYFLLSGQWLFYYKSQSSYSKGDPPHKALDVADTWIMEKGIVRSGNKRLYAIAINHQRPEAPDRDAQVLCIGTPNIEEYALWRDSLKKARQRAQDRRMSAMGVASSRTLSGDSVNGHVGAHDSPSTASSVRAASAAAAAAAGPSGSSSRAAAPEPESPKDGGSIRGRFSSEFSASSQRAGSGASTTAAAAPAAPQQQLSPSKNAEDKPPAAGSSRPPSAAHRVTPSAGANGTDANPPPAARSLRALSADPAPSTPAPHASGHHSRSNSGVPPSVSGQQLLPHSASTQTVGGAEATPLPAVEAGVARQSKMSAIKRIESFIPPELVEYQQLAKTGVAAGLPSGLRQSETGLRFPPGANGGAGAAAAAAAGDPDGPLAQALNKVAELGEEEEQVDSGDSVDYRQFDIWRLVHLENGLRFEEDMRWYCRICAQDGGEGPAAGGGPDPDPIAGQPLGFFRRALYSLTAPPPPCRVRGRVRAPPKLIHHLLADNGPLRKDWDPTFISGQEVEPDASDDIGGHSQLVHLLLRPLNVWGINCSRPRDAVLLQHWRLEEGTYLMTFTSMPKYDSKVPVAPGAVRFSTGGFIEIRPMGGDGSESLVTMVLEKTQSNGWQRAFTGRPRAFQHAVLAGYVAGLRDFVNQLSEDGLNKIWDWVAAKEKGLEASAAARLYRDGNWGDVEEEEALDSTADFDDGALSAFSSESWHESVANALAHSDALSATGGGAEAEETMEEGVMHRMSVDEDNQSFMPSVLDGDTESEACAPAACTPAAANGAAEAAAPAGGAQTARTPSSTGASPSTITPVRTRVSRNQSTDNDLSADESIPVLAGDAGGTIPLGAWPPARGLKSEGIFCQPEASLFRVRSKTYLQNSIKCAAGPPYMNLIASDWIYSDKRIDHVCRRRQNVVQRSFLKQSPNGYIFCVNIQVPAAKQYSIIFYFGAQSRPPPESAFGKFIDGDDIYRAQRFKLIPSITQGPWMVAKSVGTKPLIVGNALKAAYYQSPSYLEVDIDVGTSSVAQNVCKFVIGYLRSLVIDLAFLVESKSEADLPERLIGNIRIAYVDPANALPAWPED